MNRLPPWFRQDIPDNKTLDLMHLFSEFGVHTVCQEAKCPNMNYCFRNNKATFMILGDTCTRNCSFCNVNPVRNTVQTREETLVSNGVNKSGGGSRLSQEAWVDEAEKISTLVKMLGMRYVVITSVSRDDLADGGAGQFAKTIELVRGGNKDIEIEVLIPDFQGEISSLKCVLDACPDVIGHNIETVRRLYKDLRPKADYQLSLEVLSKIKQLKPQIHSKSSIMLGLGETEEEVINTMQDLRNANCDTLTLGQYLAPSVNHYPVKEFVGIEQFQKYRVTAVALGFKMVCCGPLVRSSFRAEEAYRELSLCMI